MTEIVEEIYATYRPLIQPSLQFHLELNETLSLPVDIDRSRFIQVITNFLNNANKFTQSGYIELGCRLDTEHKEVCIYVEDSGRGIEEKELMMIFERFYKSVNLNKVPDWDYLSVKSLLKDYPDVRGQFRNRKG